MQQKKKPFSYMESDDTQKFVNSMIESSKKPYNTPKPNNSNQDLKEIEELTGRLKKKLMDN